MKLVAAWVLVLHVHYLSLVPGSGMLSEDDVSAHCGDAGSATYLADDEDDYPSVMSSLEPLLIATLKAISQYVRAMA